MKHFQGFLVWTNWCFCSFEGLWKCLWHMEQLLFITFLLQVLLCRSQFDTLLKFFWHHAFGQIFRGASVTSAASLNEHETFSCRVLLPALFLKIASHPSRLQRYILMTFSELWEPPPSEASIFSSEHDYKRQLKLHNKHYWRESSLNGSPFGQNK